jgi:hypothetical protein
MTNVVLEPMGGHHYDFSPYVRIGEALRDCPRFHVFNLHTMFPTSSCVRVAQFAMDLGMPRQDAYGKSWDIDFILRYLQDVHFDKILAFSMGHHLRLGAASPVVALSGDLVNAIILSFFRLPHNYLCIKQPDHST